jgi:hypothetical protein
MVEAPPSWPALSLARADVGSPVTRDEVTEDRARLQLADGGSAELDRAASSAQLRLPAGVSDGAVIHPYLAPVALVMARWLGREGFHGGGVAVDGGVWGVLADKEGGKSTLLAWLALAGSAVVTDDVLVLDHETVLAGPRSLDLRADAATELGAGEPMGRVGARERWRLSLPPVAAELPLRGWVTLKWGDTVAVESVRGAARLTALVPHRGVRLASLDPAGLIALSGLPHRRLVRPRAWASLPEAADRLLEAIAG